jgi:HK97 family phage portal protein
MGIFTALFEKRSSGTLSSPPDFLMNAFGGGITKAGIHVNESRALSLTPVWGAIGLISRTMSIFPLHVYKNAGDGKKEHASHHRLYQLLHSEPNENMTKSHWCKVMAQNELLYGAGISKIEFDGDGWPVALWPIPTPRVTPGETQKGEFVYLVTDGKGQQKTLWPHELLIFTMWPTEDGNGWRSPIATHRETLGAALAAKEFGASVFGQGVNPAGTITGLSPAIGNDALKTRKERFDVYHGLGASHKLMLLEGNEKFERVTGTSKDAQYLESRQFDIAEIARIYGVPLFMLQDHEKSTSWGTGLIEINQQFIDHTMMPYCTQWEEEINKKLLDGGRRFYCRFSAEGLLRGSPKDRMEAYKTGAQMGLYSIDEMRKLEDMNPLEGGIGAARLVPLNMATIESVVNGKAENNQNAEVQNDS